jgi:GDP-4-dehydro-6-deoxy-D-mannose reductase
MNIIVTGAFGFVGHYTIQTLSQSHTCIALSNEKGLIDLRDVQEIKSFLFKSGQMLQNRQILKDDIQADFQLNLQQRDYSESLPVIFDAVIHLAAQSFVPESFKNPLETYDINFVGTYNLFRALKEYGFHGKVLYVSSGDVYGLVEKDKLPIKEDYPSMPRNPYAVSKVAAEALCYQWSVTENMKFIIARPFNHIGPKQSERFVVSSLAKQVVEIELGLRKPVISIGDIDVTRDFLDVRDVVDAYQLLLEKELNHGINQNNYNAYKIYNICSGRETSIRTIIDLILEITGVEVKIEIDVNKLRSNEQRRMYGSRDKLENDTGWQPKLLLKQSLIDIINDWRGKLKSMKKGGGI